MNARCGLLLLSLAVLLGCGPGADPLPPELAGLSLEKRLEGEAAKRFVDRLHGQEVTPADNEIGFYTGAAGRATVYVTHYAQRSQALAERRRMMESISSASAVFTQIEQLELEGKQVHRCLGMGQVHYVFDHGQSLFWVAVDPVLGAPFLRTYLIHLD
jgi:hypothetical protein